MMTFREWCAWIEAVLAHTELANGQKLVLIRIAMHHNFTSGRCDPGTATVGHGCGGLKERTVRNTAMVAEKLGLLLRNQGGGRGNTNSYRLLPQETRHGGAGFPEEKPGVAVHETRHGGAEKPGMAVPLNNKENNGDALEGFEGFWRAYPKREARPAAEKAYRAVVQRGLATPEQLEAGAKRYAQKVGGWAPHEYRFVKEPANWLQGQRWLDEPDTRNAKRAEIDRLFAKLPPEVQAQALAKAGGRR